MTDAEINFALDDLCSKARTAERLNCLHACRPGHPLGRDNKWKWRNAEFTLQNPEFYGVNIDWVSEQAAKEWDNER